MYLKPAETWKQQELRDTVHGRKYPRPPPQVRPPLAPGKVTNVLLDWKTGPGTERTLTNLETIYKNQLAKPHQDLHGAEEPDFHPGGCREEARREEARQEGVTQRGQVLSNNNHDHNDDFVTY